MTEQFRKMIVQTANIYGQKEVLNGLTPPVVQWYFCCKEIVKSVTEKFATSSDTGVTLEAEDFANYMERSKCFVFIGAGCPTRMHHRVLDGWYAHYHFPFSICH